jgi:hypothetical protein
MKTAALAGLDVRVMIAPNGAEWSPAYRAGATYAADMDRAGVRVLLYQGAYFHSKTVCVDSTLCSIGSANMDIRSFSINYETNLVIYDEAITRELEADFTAALPRSWKSFICSIEKKNWKHRVEQSKERGVDANANAQRQDGGDGEPADVRNWPPRAGCDRRRRQSHGGEAGIEAGHAGAILGLVAAALSTGLGRGMPSITIWHLTTPLRSPNLP